MNDVAANDSADPSVEENSDDLLPIVESLLFAAHESLSAQRIARAIGHLKVERISAAIDALQRGYDAKRSPLMLVEIAGGWRLVTRPEYAPFLARLFSRAEKERLSSAALETLAIVAYRQPATRAEIEAVRGVQVGPVLKLLQERRLVKMVGRAEVVGRPLQYGTTRKFLDHFGLASLEELPKVFPGKAPPVVAAAAPIDAAASDGAGALCTSDAAANLAEEAMADGPLAAGVLDEGDADHAAHDDPATTAVGAAEEVAVEETANGDAGLLASGGEAPAPEGGSEAPLSEPLAAGGISRAGRGRGRRR